MSNKNYKQEFALITKRALFEISKNKLPTIQFCGPISTGGFGNTKDNLAVLSEIIRLCNKKNIFI